MPGKSDLRAAGAGWHAVQFYGDDRELAVSVSTYLAEGLLAGDSALVVATLPHRRAFEAELARAGVDVPGALAAGHFVVLDAAQTLEGFCIAGQLDRERFDATVGSLLGPAADAGRPVRIYAEMVAQLWDSGHLASAIELEALWNDIGTRFPFSLLCAYPDRLIGGEADADALAEVCGLHEGGVIGHHPGRQDEDACAGRVIEASRSFPQALESARAARYFVLDTLGPNVDAALATDAAIVTAELAANAVLHARSEFTLAVYRSATSVRISVSDNSPLPNAGRMPLALNHGHGLWLVAEVADDWAVEPLSEGKVVWAELTDHLQAG